MAVAKLNNYCQQAGLDTPNYTHGIYPEGFICRVEWQGKLYVSETYPSKQKAKEDVATKMLESSECELVYKDTPVLNEIDLDPHMTLFIDGDQRADVINWLKMLKRINGLSAEIFVSPTSSIDKDVFCGRNEFTMYVAKSTGRDASDAMLLFNLGGHVVYHRSKPENIIIVSSDHILVQAAMDNGMKWAKNLKELQEILKPLMY